MVLSTEVNEESGIKLVDDIVKKWDVNECWLYCIDFLEKTDSQLQFRSENGFLEICCHNFYQIFCQQLIS